MIDEFRFRSTFATETYLKITEDSYLDFLEEMPFYIDNQVKVPNSDEFESQSESRVYEFTFNEIVYEVILRTGLCEVENFETCQMVPLPTNQDEIIKKIIINSVRQGGRLSSGSFFQIYSENQDDFVSVIQENSFRSGFSFEVNSIISAFVRLNNCSIYIRRKGLKLFYPVSWIMMYHAEPLSNNFYSSLIEKSDINH